MAKILKFSIYCPSLRKKCRYSELSWSVFSRIFGASLRIQSECGKMWTRKTPNTSTFHAVRKTERSSASFQKMFCRMNIDGNKSSEHMMILKELQPKEMNPEKEATFFKGDVP